MGDLSSGNCTRTVAMHPLVYSAAVLVPTPQKKLWRILVLLAPLAAVLGMFFAYRYSTTANVGVAITRSEVVRIARAQAAAKGVKADRWRTLVDLKANNDLRHYLDVTATPAQRAEITRLLSPIVYRCALENPERPTDSVHITVTPDGRLRSYAVPPVARVDVPEQAARAAAEQELRARLGADRDAFSFAGVSSERHEPTSSEVRRFTYKREISGEFSIETEVAMSGVTAIGFSIVPRIATAYLQRHAELGLPMRMTRGIGIGLLVLLGAIYVIARFVKRMR